MKISARSRRLSSDSCKNTGRTGPCHWASGAFFAIAFTHQPFERNYGNSCFIRLFSTLFSARCLLFVPSSFYLSFFAYILAALPVLAIRGVFRWCLESLEGAEANSVETAKKVLRIGSLCIGFVLLGLFVYWLTSVASKREQKAVFFGLLLGFGGAVAGSFMMSRVAEV